jgi:eukaryotic-like serine/threonine-protein kinase
VTSSEDGRVAGRYELVTRIARGGGGTVWRARDTTLGRTVAVKEIRVPDELSPDERERARRRVLYEARAAARLDHPGAVVVHDVLDGDDRLHLVMELVDAPTLRERVERDGPLPDEDAATVGLALLDVIATAHERGIVHRDIKPSNIFVLDGGGVKLADFGIAALTGESSLTRTGTALGSPSYLAPEQAQGETAAPPADLWGLGASLYYAVEGVPPFDRGHAVATVHAVVHDEPRPVRRASTIAPLLHGLLEKRPDRRPSLEEVREQLEAAAGVDPPAAPPAEAEPATTAPLPAVAAPAPTPTGTSDPPAATRADEEHPPAATRADEEHPPAATRAGDDDHPRRRVSPALVGVLAIAALVGLASLVLLTDGREDAGEEVAEAPADDGSATPPEDDPDRAEDAPDDAAERPDDGGDPPEPDEDAGADEGGDGPTEIPEADVPDGWQVVEGETYRVAIPAGWEVRDAPGNLTDHVDPATGAYLRVDWTDDPAADPVADWEANERGFAERQDAYERVRLEPATYRGEDAALWEYTYRDGGADLHALNLNLLAGDRAYALNLQAPAEDWDEVAALFPAIAGGFDPDG